VTEELRHGVLLLDKQPDWTSHDVVQKVRRLIQEKKVGHCGTLDPAATGLLVVTVGRATRLTRFLIRAPKLYEGTIRLGIATDSYDAEGKVVAERPVEGVTLESLSAAMTAFEGAFEQLPPPFSAKKVGGVKLYELARRGEEVPQEAKTVTVFEFSPLPGVAGTALEEGSAAFRLACSSGTYARTLVHDLGARLGCGAHLSALRRLSVGPFQVADALTVPDLAAKLDAGAELGAAWRPFDQVPLPFGEVTADSQQEQRIHHGQTVLVRDLAGAEGDWVKLINLRRQFIAVGTVVERIGSAGVGVVQPKVVFK
jgi:tRNA pseudouridine55 synthase